MRQGQGLAISRVIGLIRLKRNTARFLNSSRVFSGLNLEEIHGDMCLWQVVPSRLKKINNNTIPYSSRKCAGIMSCVFSNQRM